MVKREDGTAAEHHGACIKICGQPYSTCTHACKSKCHSGACAPCSEPCEVRCAHSRCRKKCGEPCVPCSHDTCTSACPHQKCTMPCAVPCNWLPCGLRCQKKLDCNHTCPSLCGEPCPPKEMCQQCAKESVKSTVVDYIEFREYKDVDLDQDPCIFPPCGHVKTMSNFDGHFSMQDVYHFDEQGLIVGVIKSSTPFSAEDAMKQCPDCRGSLRQTSRYGRIIRRSMLDEATKRFIT